MQDRALIHKLEFIAVPLPEPQPIAEMVPQHAPGAGLHAADSSVDPLSVDSEGRLAGQVFRAVTEKSRVPETVDVPFDPGIRHDLGAGEKAVEQGEFLLKFRVSSRPLDILLEHAGHKALRACPVPDPVPEPVQARGLHGQGGKEPLQRQDQVGGPQAPALLGHSGKGNRQCVGGLGHIHVEIQSLDKHLLAGGGRQDRSPGGQKFPVHIGQEASAGRPPRNISLVDTGHEEVADLREAGALDIADQDPVHTLRQGSEPDLGQACLDQFQIIPCAHALTSGQTVDLVQQVDHRPVDLAVLLLPDHIPVLREALRQGRHPLLCPAAHQKGIELTGALCRRPPGRGRHPVGPHRPCHRPHLI